MKKLLSVLCIALLLLLCVSCGGDEEKGECKVTLIIPSGVTVTGDNPIYVPRGGDAVFNIQLGETVAYQGSSAGVYDADAGTLTVKNVTRDMRVELEAKDVGTGVKYQYRFNGTKHDSSDVADGSLTEGTRITVTAGDDKRAFTGWSFGGYLGSGGVFISDERVCTFVLREALTANGRCYIFPNYADSNIMYYKANGGTVNAGSENLSYKGYYKATVAADTVEVVLNSEYFEVIGCASTFWDDGSFTREGYVLKEYNTSPDGTGTGYSLGSKFSMEGGATLYCIWEKDTTHSDFEYRDITLKRPSGVTTSLAPHWVEEGIIITAYKGDSKTVAIPERIDGKYVIAIGKGAFTDKSLETLVMGRRVLKIEDGAFVRCKSLTTFHYPDGIYYITNSAFDSATYDGFTRLFVNATISPRYSSAEGGCFSNKFARLISHGDENRVIVISGSSSYCGLSTEYLQSLLEYDYTVVNFGTTRTTQIYMYLEAMGTYAHEGDIVLYAPENSIYEMGEGRLYWKTLRDLEGMYNIFRCVDISNYENFFGAFAAFNGGSAEGEDYEPIKKGRYARAYDRYENALNSGSFNVTGEYNVSAMNRYCDDKTIYKALYEITLNRRFKSIAEGSFVTADPENEDWRTSEKWCSADTDKYLRNMNAAINSAKSSGAAVYFTFAPMDADSITEDAVADPYNWFSAYESFIAENYDFDGILGSTENYIFNHKYFYNNAYHTNNYGRAYRTYRMYLDLAELLGITDVLGMKDVPAASDCLYEDGAVSGPITGVDYLK